MQWFLDLSHGLQAAAILGVLGTVVMLGAGAFSATIVTVLACAAPVLAALPAALQPSPDSFPVLVVCAATLVCALLSRRDELANQRHFVENGALQLFGAAGACVLATATELLSLLIGFEAMSLAVAVLAGIGAGSRPLEAAFRFFVLAAASAATLVFGIALHAYATGSFIIGAPVLERTGLAAMHVVAVLVMVLGVAFELAIVPFHFGTLGLCYAAPVSCVTFAMTVSKVGAALALARLVGADADLQPVMVGLAIVTIAWATLAGWAQRHLRGLLAYSAIAHAGFLALAVGSGPVARSALCFYVVVYAASVALVFGALAGTGTGPSDDRPLAELGRRPMGWLARASLVLGLLSLAGMPPTPGFLAKMAILTQAWDGAGIVPTALATTGAVFGALIYLRPVPDLAAGFRADAGAAESPLGARLVMTVAALATLAFGVMPQLAARLYV